MLGTHLVSFILSQFFGLYLLIIAVIMFLRVERYRQLAHKLNPDSGTILLGGLIGLMLGLFFVGIHNVWVFKPTVVITMACWLILVFSILLLVTPEKMVIWTKVLCSGSRYYILASLILLFGLLFLSRGLYQYATHNESFFFMHV